MKGSIGFGTPKQQRHYMQYGYGARPSFWQEVRANAHLIIAAVGTAALLGIAGIALWLAMPQGDRQAFAAAKQPVEKHTAAARPVAAQPTASQPVEAAMAPQSDGNGLPAPRVVKTRKIVVDGGYGEAAPKGDAVTAALPVTDPRWSAAGAKTDPPQNPITSQADQATDARPQGAQAASAAPTDEAAFAAAEPVAAAIPVPQDPPKAAAQDNTDGDGAQTASIVDVKPQKPEPSKASGNGHILRDVTMRSGPKKSAAQVGTIPARAAVSVITCKQWCEVVYKGKTGWIYKGFLGRN